MKMKEYVVWGIAPTIHCRFCKAHSPLGDGRSGHDDMHEDALVEAIDTPEEAERVMGVLTAKHGITKARVQVIDFSNDLAKCGLTPN
tara:strand:+ start:377 stop:637 length:261 start_codon:yes stop_codon:yes gene_type:complete